MSADLPPLPPGVRDDLLAVLETMPGARVLAWLIFDHCRLMKTVDVSRIKHELGYNLAEHNGARWVGEQLLVRLQTIEPRAYELLLAAEKARAERLRRVVGATKNPTVDDES